MRRVIGTLLFGLGVLSLVLAGGLPLYVAPAATKLPYDLENTTSVVVAKNATFVQVVSGAAALYKGDLKSTTQVVPQPKLTDQLQGEFKDKAVVWDVYSTTKRLDNDQVISASSTEIALDRVSGAAYDWSGAWVDESNSGRSKATKTTFSGHSYKFPFNTEKKDYPFWDGELGHSTIPAKYQSTENVGGLDAYVFQQVIPLSKTSIDATTKAVLLATFAPTAKDGEMYYSNTRTLWVEPTTGAFVDVREQRHLEFRDDAGGKTTLLDVDFRYDQTTKDKSVKTATDNRTLLMAVSLYAPIGLAVLGIIFVVVGLMLMRGREDGAAPKHSLEEL